MRIWAIMRYEMDLRTRIQSGERRAAVNMGSPRQGGADTVEAGRLEHRATRARTEGKSEQVASQRGAHLSVTASPTAAASRKTSDLSS